MGDLISRSTLIETIVNTPTEESGYNPVYLSGCATRQHEIIDIIDSLPTAYNLEEVVKRLEELPVKTTSKMVESKEVPEWFCEVITGEYINKKDALEIIRKGGVDNGL